MVKQEQARVRALAAVAALHMRRKQVMAAQAERRAAVVVVADRQSRRLALTATAALARVARFGFSSLNKTRQR